MKSLQSKKISKNLRFLIGLWLKQFDILRTFSFYILFLHCSDIHLEQTSVTQAVAALSIVVIKLFDGYTQLK